MNQTQIEQLQSIIAQAREKSAELTLYGISPTGKDYGNLYALVKQMAKAIPDSVTESVQGEAESRRVAAMLVAESVSFSCEPCPDDVFEFTVKREHASVLRSALQLLTAMKAASPIDSYASGWQGLPPVGERESIMDVDGLPRLMRDIIRTKGSPDALGNLYDFVDQWGEARVAFAISANKSNS